MNAGSGSSLEVIALPAFDDNYIWIIADPISSRCVVVDPGSAIPVANWLRENPSWSITDVLITHHHFDHIGGVEQLKEQYGVRVWGPALEEIPLRDVALHDADEISILGRPVRVFALPGHTIGHVAYYIPSDSLVFTGDTLFAGGCGRLFEGTAAQMFDSIERLAKLPDETKIYCAHEYTLNNLRFANAVEPGNTTVAARLEFVEQIRAQELCTLPSTVQIEKETNPYMRVGQKCLWEAVGANFSRSVNSALECFTLLRRWKDEY